MNTMKTLMLAGFAALSLGVGTAMAQDGGGATADYWARQYRIQATQANQDAVVQFGSSDHHIAPAPAFDTDLTGGGL
jgi:hypothetical protein